MLVSCPSWLSSETRTLPLTHWVSNSYDTYWRLIHVCKQLLDINRRRGFNWTASEVVQGITFGHSGSERSSLPSKNFPCILWTSPNWSIGVTRKAGWRARRYTPRIRCRYLLSLALHYTIPLMIHIWRMVTENCVWWKILKCCVWHPIFKPCVWRVISKHCVWRPPDASEMQCFKTFRNQASGARFPNHASDVIFCDHAVRVWQNLTVYRIKYKYPCTLLGPYDL